MTIEQQIRFEIYQVFIRLRADRELLGTIRSWADTRLDNDEVLRILKQRNMDKAKRGAVEALQRIAPQSDNRPFLVPPKKGRATASGRLVVRPGEST
jgi:hypothetical protein